MDSRIRENIQDSVLSSAAVNVDRSSQSSNSLVEENASFLWWRDSQFNGGDFPLAINRKTFDAEWLPTLLEISECPNAPVTIALNTIEFDNQKVSLIQENPHVKWMFKKVSVYGNHTFKQIKNMEFSQLDFYVFEGKHYSSSVMHIFLGMNIFSHDFANMPFFQLAMNERWTKDDLRI